MLIVLVMVMMMTIIIHLTCHLNLAFFSSEHFNAAIITLSPLLLASGRGLQYWAGKHARCHLQYEERSSSEVLPEKETKRPPMAAQDAC